jgi:hypothetical protein
VRARFWIEIVLGAVGALLAIASYIEPQWIEVLFEASPDNGSGEAEWLLSAFFLLAALVSFALAGVEWRRKSSVEGARSHS